MKIGFLLWRIGLGLAIRPWSIDLRPHLAPQRPTMSRR